MVNISRLVIKELNRHFSNIIKIVFYGFIYKTVQRNQHS